MNVFVLCTGRCGSTTFIEAARHLTNFSSAHESRTAMTGHGRFAYPVNHIEADNRLSWLLGRLDASYGDQAWYVHLQRDSLATARSFRERWDRGIMHAYRTEILMGAGKRQVFTDDDKLQFCLDYCETVNSNISHFLRDKTKKMTFTLENAQCHWSQFCEWVGAQGNLDAAAAEWSVRHNATAD